MEDVLTQSELTTQSCESVKRANAKLDEALNTYNSYLTFKDSTTLSWSHKCWLKYAELEAQIAGSGYDGGSIQTMMCNLRMLEVIEARIADIERQTDLLCV